MPIYSPIIQWMGGNGQALGYTTASSTASTGMPAGTTAVRMVASTDVYLEIALGASASAGVSGFLPAGVVEYVPMGESNTISAKGVTVDGTLYIKPCCG